MANAIIIVCKRERKTDEPIKLFNAKDLYQEDHFLNKFDFNSFIELFNAEKYYSFAFVNYALKFFECTHEIASFILLT